MIITGTDELGSGRDNRDIMDDGASQELTERNITEMKGQGASGKVHIYKHDSYVVVFHREGGPHPMESFSNSF